MLSGLAVAGQVVLMQAALSDGRRTAYVIGLGITALVAVIGLLMSALAVRMGTRLSAGFLTAVSVWIAILVYASSPWVSIPAAVVALVVITASWWPSSQRFRQARAGRQPAGTSE